MNLKLNLKLNQKKIIPRNDNYYSSWDIIIVFTYFYN